MLRSRIIFAVLAIGLISLKGMAAEFRGSCVFGSADPENVLVVDSASLTSLADFESALSEYSSVIEASDKESEPVLMTIAFERSESLRQQSELNQQVMSKIQSIEASYKNLKVCIVTK